ncbi:Zinc finger MYM-type protein 1-like [Oopsacas minuta]|uniref:Zinc finger MYM-type protein 1-like n=1 Tax=Oopsacas minuta TaxID=111878 RepID=A0AAV7JGN8_9METZ|nr:Zinc finger MYM-type protein 1-like [Oopsacas minuta]
MSRKFNITNSSQLTLFATYKRIKLTSADGKDITYDNIDHSREAQEPDFVPPCDTSNLVSSDPIDKTTLPSRAPTQKSISPETPNVKLHPPLDIAQGPNDKPIQPSGHTCRFPSTLVGTKKRQFNPEWYVDDKANIHERFLTFVDAISLTAESLTTYFISTLSKHGLDRSCIVSQGNDGAAVMSGNCHGVQQRMKEINPCANTSIAMHTN